MSEKPSSMRTDFARVRHLGSAHSGTSHAWMMRVTSIALIPLSLLFVWLIISMIGRDYDSMLRLFGGRIGPGAVALLFVLTGCYHMRGGMQTIIEDYVHDRHAKEWAIVGNTLFCGLIAAATALAIVKISLG